jgi:hypothetical protein
LSCCSEAYCPLHWSLFSCCTEAYCPVAVKPIALYTEAYCPVALKPIVLLQRSLLPFTLKPIFLLHWSLLPFCTETYCPVAMTFNPTHHCTVSDCTTSLTFCNSTFYPHRVFVCFIWIWEQTLEFI